MSKKILLCDDEIHIVRTAEIRLVQAGFTVRIARDGQEAWEAILEDQPDVVVTDLQMPRMDGLELIQRIRANAKTKDLPVLMLTAKGFELAREELMQKWGIFAILSKPFSPRELARLIDQALGTTATC
jgi:two-component system, OmpR family, alkaline phosphatase synthesis response regulator PhoP